MSFVYLKDFVINVGALVGEFGLAAAQAALTWWSRVRPQRASAGPATLARNEESVPFDLSQDQVKEVSREIPGGPVTAAPKKKKSVSFDLSQNEVNEVENWFDPAIHRHRTVVYPWVHWNAVRLEATVERYLEPHGHWQRSFPRTTWPRDVPDDVEDDNGDIEMLDV